MHWFSLRSVSLRLYQRCQRLCNISEFSTVASDQKQTLILIIVHSETWEQDRFCRFIMPPPLLEPENRALAPSKHSVQILFSCEGLKVSGEEKGKRRRCNEILPPPIFLSRGCTASPKLCIQSFEDQISGCNFLQLCASVWTPRGGNSGLVMYQFTASTEWCKSLWLYYL